MLRVPLARGRRLHKETKINTFDVAVLYPYLPDLFYGALLTLTLTFEVVVGGVAIGLAGALLHIIGPSPVRIALNAWIEITRNTPVIIQLFLIYFGLPQFGIRLDSNWAAIVGLSFYLGAFATEIIRAGVDSIPKSQIEAGTALGLSPLKILRLIVLVPALRAVAPALAGQIVLIMLTTSIVSTISADELSSITNGLQSKTFRPFEFYAAASALYVAMALIIRFALAVWVSQVLRSGPNARRPA